MRLSSYTDDKLRHNIVKATVENRTRGSAVNFDNVTMKFIFNKRTDAYKTDVNLFFFFYTITTPQSGQMPGINVGKRRRKLAVNKAK